VGAGGVPQSFIDFIKLREGVRTRVYKDSRGFPTAGIGHLLTAAEKQRYPVGSTVPQAVLDGWFAQNSQGAYRVALQQAQQVGLANNPHAVDIFGSMSYQLGNAWPRVFPQMFAALRNKDYASAIRNAQQSAWARQTPVRVKDFVDMVRSLQH
jgi:GH24 family phage-related lysozyme (muramidase)